MVDQLLTPVPMLVINMPHTSPNPPPMTPLVADLNAQCSVNGVASEWGWRPAVGNWP